MLVITRGYPTLATMISMIYLNDKLLIFHCHLSNDQQSFFCSFPKQKLRSGKKHHQWQTSTVGNLNDFHHSPTIRLLPWILRFYKSPSPTAPLDRPGFRSSWERFFVPVLGISMIHWDFMGVNGLGIHWNLGFRLQSTHYSDQKKYPLVNKHSYWKLPYNGFTN